MYVIDLTECEFYETKISSRGDSVFFLVGI